MYVACEQQRRFHNARRGDLTLARATSLGYIQRTNTAANRPRDAKNRRDAHNPLSGNMETQRPSTHTRPQTEETKTRDRHPTRPGLQIQTEGLTDHRGDLTSPARPAPAAPAAPAAARACRGARQLRASSPRAALAGGGSRRRRRPPPPLSPVLQDRNARMAIYGDQVLPNCFWAGLKIW